MILYWLFTLLTFGGLMYLVIATQDFDCYDPWFYVVMKGLCAAVVSSVWPLLIVLSPVAVLCYYAYKRNKTVR